MSKGNTIITMRVEPGLLQEIERSICRANEHRFEGPLTRTDWLMQAIREKIDHAERAKKSRRKNAGKVPPKPVNSFGANPEPSGWLESHDKEEE